MLGILILKINGRFLTRRPAAARNAITMNVFIVADRKWTVLRFLNGLLYIVVTFN
jgi:hypothetical protein